MAGLGGCVGGGPLSRGDLPTGHKGGGDAFMEELRPSPWPMAIATGNLAMARKIPALVRSG
jgi:hypothetical protein